MNGTPATRPTLPVASAYGYDIQPVSGQDARTLDNRLNTYKAHYSPGRRIASTSNKPPARRLQRNAGQTLYWKKIFSYQCHPWEIEFQCSEVNAINHPPSPSNTEIPTLKLTHFTTSGLFLLPSDSMK